VNSWLYFKFIVIKSTYLLRTAVGIELEVGSWKRGVFRHECTNQINSNTEIPNSKIRAHFSATQIIHISSIRVPKEKGAKRLFTVGRQLCALASLREKR
jgi:hypothetical protein